MTESVDYDVEKTDTDELKESITELIETIKTDFVISDDNEKLDELIDFLKEEKELEIEQRELEKDEKSEEIEKLSAIEELLQKDELTEEEQEELDLLLAEEEEFHDLQKGYLTFQVENGQDQFENILLINENLEMIIEQNDVIIAQNEITNTADQLTWFYGLFLVPGFLISFIAYRFLKKFL